MRCFFLERDNVTYPCDPDVEGYSYVASFEFFPFHEGATFAIYKGLLSGDVGRRGQFCVVKTLVERPAARGELDHVIERAREAQRLADIFNGHMGYRAVWFAIPSLARLKHVSDFNGMFRCVAPHDKRLKREEFVVIETFLEGKFQVFNSNNGTVPSRASTSTSSTSVVKIPKSKNKKKRHKTDVIDSSSSSCPITESSIVLSSNNLAQAFGHYVWYATGSSVVCGLEGIFSNSCYLFTTPVIHSLSSCFGVTDGGPDAIAQFFASHRCTNICYQWPVYNHRSSNCKKQINFFEPDLLSSSSKFATPDTDKNIFVETTADLSLGKQ